ncbi:MAG: NTP transferase domain-containing protein [Clostridiales bacterium]|nr:NTP transferase domain-containing protein [Clostridiales bacterium]
MKAVIMAGGEGSRLRPLTCTRPKPMLRICGKPVLGHIIDLLVKHGFDDIAVTVKYRAEDIENYIEDLEIPNLKIKCIRESSPLGTAGSVKNAAQKWDEPFLVVSGDCMCDMDFSKFMVYHKAVMADITVVCVSVDDPREYGTVCMSDTGEIESFCEKPDWSHASSNLANTGIYIVNPAVLDLVPDGVNYDFASHLFPDMMQEGKRLFGYHATGYWCDIGSLKSYRICWQHMMSSKIKNPTGLSSSFKSAPYGYPKGNYSIVPPVYIGKNVSIGDNTVLGPFTVIEDNVTVGSNSRLKKSIVMNNSSVGGGCDMIGAVIGDNCVIKSNTVCLEGSCIGDGSTIESGSTVSNNVLVWPEKRVPYRSVLTENLREGRSDYELLNEDGIKGVTFAEMSCEKCCRLGEALASSSCGGKVGVGYDSSRLSKAVAMAVLSGLISGGSVISDFGECYESQMSFFVSFCSLDSGIYICANPKTTEIRLFGRYGLPLYRKHEREIESRYKRSDFRRCCGADCNEIRDMSAVSDIYEGQLLAFAGGKLSGAAGKIVSPNPMVEYTAERCFYLLGCVAGDLPEFTVDYSGKKAVASDEKNRAVTYEKLLVLCGMDSFANGDDICVPFDAPNCLDDLASEHGCRVFRTGKSPMKEYEEDIAYAVKNTMWAYDGLALVFKVMGMMNTEDKSLYELTEKIPVFHIAKKVVASDISPSVLSSLLGIRADGESQGLRTSGIKGTVSVTETAGGRLIKIIAEAANMEAAKELCAETADKIEHNALDIYHQIE